VTFCVFGQGPKAGARNKVLVPNTKAVFPSVLIDHGWRNYLHPFRVQAKPRPDLTKIAPADWPDTLVAAHRADHTLE
jgi:hypothetical protein